MDRTPSARPDAAPPSGDRRRPSPDESLKPALLLLSARQLADIWMTLFTMAGMTIVALILVLATLRTYWQVPMQVYMGIALFCLTCCVLGLVRGFMLLRQAERSVRDHGP